MKAYLLILFAFFYNLANANTYYFSSISGDDSRTSTQVQNPSTPWKTLTKLNSIFASFKPGDSVLFSRGNTFYGTIVISQSGSAAMPIVIGAYGSGARPIISGFQTITDWEAIGKGIYQNTCSSCQANLNMVTFQDTFQPMGRWPKLNILNGGYLKIDSHTGSGYLTSSELSGALNYVGGEIVSRKLQWVMSRARITAQTNNSIKCIPFTSVSGDDDDLYNNHGFFIQNNVNTCTTLGEWAFDSMPKKIKMYFGNNNPSNYTIQASTLDYLVTIKNFNNYIIFDNIAFKGSNVRTFNIETCNHIQINNCDIKFSGIDAVWVTSSSSTNNITISNCSICFTNNNGITANNTTKWIITKNTFLNTGMVRGAGSQGDCQYEGMSLIGSASLIQNNIIKNTGYLGINFRGDSVVIRSNYIDSFCIIKTDGGAIYNYADTNKFGRKIIGNIILNGFGDNYGKGIDLTDSTEKSICGIYLDGGSRNVEVDSNTVAHCDYTGIQLNYNRNIKIRNNTLFDNGVFQITYSDWGHSFASMNVRNNIFFAKDSIQAVLFMHMASNYVSSIGTIDSNYYCRPIWEPSNVDAKGYSHGISPQWWPSWTDGAVCVSTIEGTKRITKFNSLDKWQTFSTQDIHSKKTQVSIPKAGSIIFEYNASDVPKLVTLNDNYVDIKNDHYSNSVTLQPFTSVILIKTEDIQNAAPTVSLTSPSANLKTTAPASINISATAVDSDGSISKIEFYNGDSLLATEKASPYKFSWNSVSAGNYVLTAKATDNDGLVSSSKSVTISVTNAKTPPRVIITSPLTNTSFTPPSSINIGAEASDTDGLISKVEFYNGNTFLGSSGSRPFSFTWSTVAPGNYALTAKAIDNDGLITLSPIVNVVMISANIASTVSITSPLTNAIFNSSDSIKINAVASDTDGLVRKVEFYNGNSLLGSSNVRPYSLTWNNVATGNYLLTARSTDNGGLVTSSNTVKVSVVSANIAPIVKITTPAKDTSFTAPAKITLVAAANDSDGKISKVEFYSNTTLIKSKSKGPYTCNWKNVVAGNYIITAKAYDNNGLSTVSDPITIVVLTKNINNATSSNIVKSLDSDKTIFNNRKQSISIGVGPNPTNNILSVFTNGFQKNIKLKMSVLSMDGIQLKSFVFNTDNHVIQLDVSSFNSGSYITKFVFSDNVIYKQFIKL